MKVIITKRFEKEYLKNFKKYFSTKDLVLDLKNKKHTFISLHDPFFKIKNKINLVDFRGVVAFMKNNKIIPLFIFLKKEKKCGNNVSWQNNEKLTELEFNLSVKDIEKRDFNEY